MPEIEHAPKHFPRVCQLCILLDGLFVCGLVFKRCEQLNWLTPNGRNKIQSCLGALTDLEKLGIITLPALVEHQKRGPQKKIIWSSNTDEQAPLHSRLKEIGPIRLALVTDKEEIKLWNEFLDRYHYLGYRRPIGYHLRYFIFDGQDRKLGCLFFSFASQALPCRDKWIGWELNARKKRLELVINNTRFLLFPWVKVKYLASKSLSLASKQLPADWENAHGYRPVLLETFVDISRYTGTSYQAANWQKIGKTAGVKTTTKVKGKTQKAVYIYPLSKNAKSILVSGGKTPSHRQKKTMKAERPNLSSDDPFVKLWSNIIGTVVSVSNQFDEQGP